MCLATQVNATLAKSFTVTPWISNPYIRFPVGKWEKGLALFEVFAAYIARSLQPSQQKLQKPRAYVTPPSKNRDQSKAQVMPERAALYKWVLINLTFYFFTFFSILHSILFVCSTTKGAAACAPHALAKWRGNGVMGFVSSLIKP